MTIRLLKAALLLGTSWLGMTPLVVSAPARAQASQPAVSVNNSALDALGGKPAAKPATRPRHSTAHEHASSQGKETGHGKDTGHGKETVHEREVGKPPAAAAHPAATASAPLPVIPPAPPRAAVVPPPAPIVATRPAPPLPTIPVVAGAPGDASKIAGGLRLTFGPDRSDLNPSTVNALRGLAQDAKASPGAAINVAAYAAGTPEDPSTPRRLALARALAARAVLVNEGIPSTRIYVRALGTNDEVGGPADRADVTIEAAPPPAAPEPGKP